MFRVSVFKGVCGGGGIVENLLVSAMDWSFFLSFSKRARFFDDVMKSGRGDIFRLLLPCGVLILYESLGWTWAWIWIAMAFP